MKQRNQPSNKGDQPVTFRHRDAVRINACVTDWEKNRRSRKPSQLPRAAGSGGSPAVYVAFYAGAWRRTGTKVVDVPAGGEFTASTTLVVLNMINSIPPAGSGASTRICYISQPANDPDRWVLVNAQI